MVFAMFDMTVMMPHIYFSLYLHIFCYTTTLHILRDIMVLIYRHQIERSYNYFFIAPLFVT